LFPFASWEPLNIEARNAFQSIKRQIAWSVAKNSSRRYDRVLQRARCGFPGETPVGRASPFRVSLRIRETAPAGEENRRSWRRYASTTNQRRGLAVSLAEPSIGDRASRKDQVAAAVGPN